MPTTIDRYKEHWTEEMEGAYIYRVLSSISVGERSAVYVELALAEERHAAHWATRLEELGDPVSPFRPGARARLIGWMARRFGAKSVIPLLQAFEMRAQMLETTDAPPGMERDELTHSRVLRHIGSGPEISRFERWHRRSSGGSLRAAVFGVSDGLVSNFSLVMGVAGAATGHRFVLLAGIAGLLAGAFSMGAGEYVSVRAQREAYEREIALEAVELEEMPDEEREELALIYRAKGIPADEAERLARRITEDPSTALDTLAREELGLNPEELGSPWAAALSSFFAFALGAVMPVIPYLLASGVAATLAAAALSGAALVAVGSLITLFTGKGVLRSATRMVLIGAAAATVTYLIGKAIGVGVSV